MTFSQLVHKFALLCVPIFRNNVHTILSMVSKHCLIHLRLLSCYIFKKILRNIAQMLHVAPSNLLCVAPYSIPTQIQCSKWLSYSNIFIPFTQLRCSLR